MEGIPTIKTRYSRRGLVSTNRSAYASVDERQVRPDTDVESVVKRGSPLAGGIDFYRLTCQEENDAFARGIKKGLRNGLIFLGLGALAVWGLDKGLDRNDAYNQGIENQRAVEQADYEAVRAFQEAHPGAESFGILPSGAELTYDGDYIPSKGE